VAATLERGQLSRVIVHVGRARTSQTQRVQERVKGLLEPLAEVRML